MYLSIYTRSAVLTAFLYVRVHTAVGVQFQAPARFEIKPGEKK